jgi:hypothetical protein
VEYPILTSPYMDTSKEAYERLDELYCLEKDDDLADESPEQAELLVLRALLSVKPGDTVTFEKSFPGLCDYKSDETKAFHDRVLEAWIKVGEMIEIPAEPQ